MKSEFLLLVIPVIALLNAACTSNKKEPPETNAISSKIDSSYAQIADLRIEQLKITNRYFEDPKITEAIQEYAKATTISDKIRIVEVNKTWPDEVPRPKETPQGRMDFVSHFDKIKPEEFDLAIRNNDVVAQQVRLMNNYFGELDKTTLEAIDYYEKLSKEQKARFFNETELKPVPDYEQKLLGREFRYNYYLQKQLLFRRLMEYLQRRRFINEFPQGFKQFNTIGYLNDKQFDLNIASK